MRIVHVATDEVNQSLAAQWAAKCGAIICHPRPGEVHPDGLFDAVLDHRDDVPRDQRPAFLEELCLGTRDCPSAVHGYGIADEHVSLATPAIEEKSALAVRSGPRRGYTSGGPVGPTGELPGATMRLRAVGGGPDSGAVV